MQAWEQALELREETREWWASETGQMFSKSWSATRWESSLGGMPPPAQAEKMKLAIAAPIYVTGEMVDLLEHAATTFPATSLHASDLITQTGFVLLERSIQTIDMHLRPLPWRAFSWGIASAADNLEEAVGIHLALYAHKNDDPYRDEMEGADGGAYFSTLSLVHETGWTFGQDYTGHANWVGGFVHNKGAVVPEKALESSHHMLRVIHAFLLLSQQRIGESRSSQVSRPLRRRMQRANPDRPIPEVRVITLRRRRTPTHAGEELNGGGREYTHQWWVNAHWRRQWYASEGRHKPKYIEGYVKGPEDKPFYGKDTAYIWRR